MFADDIVARCKCLKGFSSIYFILLICLILEINFKYKFSREIWYSLPNNVISTCRPIVVFLLLFAAEAFTLSRQMDPVTVHTRLITVLEFTVIEPSVLFVPTVGFFKLIFLCNTL